MSLIAVSSNTYAAACSNTSNYGTATMTVSIPATGDYRIWSRMKVPSTSSSTYQLEVDGNTCWQVGGSNVPVNSWTWVDWSGGNSLQKVNYTFTSTGNHTLKLVGSAAGVEVDKVILLGAGELCSDNGTSPAGDGSNCSAGPVATNTGTTPAPTPVNAPVAGTTTPGIVQQNQANAAKTEYFVDGKLVQSSDGAQALDTTKIPDGTHKLDTVVTLKDGTKVADSQTVIIKNNQNFFGKYKTVLTLLGVIAGIAVGLFVSWLVWFRRHPINIGQLLTRAPSQPQTTPMYHEPTIISPNTIEPDKGNEHEAPKS